MQAQSNVFSIIAYTLGALFPLWPIVMAQPLLSRHRKVIGAMLLTWIFFFIGWWLARVLPAPPLVPLIPEPLSTVLFFFTGAGIIAVHALHRMRRSL